MSFYNLAGQFDGAVWFFVLEGDETVAVVWQARPSGARRVAATSISGFTSRMASKPRRLNPRRALALSIGLSALLYLTFVLLADHRAVLAALNRLGPTALAGIFLLSLLNYGVRFWRWQRYLTALGHALPRWRHFLYYLAGFTLTVTPGKAGEAVRSLYLFPHGVPYNQSVAALLVERLLDVMAMSLLALLILVNRQMV